jgi:hypothetical protein
MLVEVRGFEPLTPCMPSTISTFPDVRSCPILLEMTALSSTDVSRRVSTFFGVACTVACIEVCARGTAVLSIELFGSVSVSRRQQSSAGELIHGISIEVEGVTA